jgi:hypothetical protein
MVAQFFIEFGLEAAIMSPMAGFWRRRFLVCRPG